MYRRIREEEEEEEEVQEEKSCICVSVRADVPASVRVRRSTFEEASCSCSSVVIDIRVGVYFQPVPPSAVERCIVHAPRSFIILERGAGVRTSRSGAGQGG